MGKGAKNGAGNGGVREEFVFFWKPDAGHNREFGQWFPSVFHNEEGLQFGCAEQYMMWRKAVLFGDLEIADTILHTVNPREHKKLGQLVRGFDEATWVEHRENIVFDGNVLKFSQNPELREALVATGTATLVEASPFDRIWGIGLTADKPAAQSKTQWRGQNLLGYALMRVRDHLRTV